jgi:hypothetical protein
MPARRDPPVPVPLVLEVAVDALLGGSAGWLKVPAGGNLRTDWLSGKGCYRLTIDVVVTGEFGSALDVEAVLELARGRVERWRRTLERSPDVTGPAGDEPTS